MKLTAGETSLVVAGAWNPAVVTPDWILKYGLKRDVLEERRVQVFVPAGPGLVFDMPRYSFDGLLVTVRPDALVIAPKEMTKPLMEEIESLAANTVTELTHTPIVGVGHNFEFRDANPKPEFLNVFSDSYGDLLGATPDGWAVSGSNLATSFTVGTATVNITRAFDGAQLSVKFNFHHPMTTGKQAACVLRGEDGIKRFFENYMLARDLITKMYGEINDD